LRLKTVTKFSWYCGLAVVALPIGGASAAAAVAVALNHGDYWRIWNSWFLGLALTTLAAVPFLIGVLNDQLKRAQAELLQKDQRYRELAETQAVADVAEFQLIRAGRLSTVGHITGLVVHELNQPLAAIVSNAEAAELNLAVTTPSLPALREIIGDLRRDSLRAATTIDRVQALVRDIDPNVGPVDVNGTIHDSLRLMRGDLTSRGLRVVSDLAASLPPVKADRHALQEVLVNLIANAIDAMEGLPDAERVLTIRTAGREDEIEVDVSDRGRGIDGQHMDRIFEPFFTTKSKGSGLGLSLSRRIVRKFSGRIWASNNCAGGASFRFTLPTEYGRNASNAERSMCNTELRS
jgi:signal transduction histidine kinase